MDQKKPTNMLTPKQRIKTLTEYYDINTKRFAEKVGLNPSNLYEILYGKTKTISLNVADHIKDVYEYVNLEWLLTGRGVMWDSLAGEEEQDADGSDAGGKGSSPKGIYLDKPAGPLAGCEIYCNIYCTNMKPVIDAGDQLLVSKWTEDFVTWGKIYIVETKKGNTTIAYLFPSNKNNRYVCRSADVRKNPDVEIAKSEIASLRIVRAKLMFL